MKEHICRQAYGPGPEGTKCKDCAHFVINKWSKGENKCELRKLSNSATTNHKGTWPTCGRFVEGKARVHFGPSFKNEKHPGQRTQEAQVS